jgi:Glycosyl hydrolases family 39
VLALSVPAQAQTANETIQIDLTAPAHPFPHFWEQMFGSGRAVLSLRDNYRRDLREVKQATGFQFIRFHAIFHDEVGLYDEDASGKPIYNFSYVDQIYDGLLQNGVRPFVELSFMPRKLAAQPIEQAFWYRPIVAPPKDWNRWGEMITQFTQHLVARYGIDEVAQWYFEVWNEPNLDFWAGDPREATYYQLYDTAARAIKAVNPRLPRRRPLGWTASSNTWSTIMFPPISLQLTYTATIWRKMFSEPMKISRARKWFAARSPRSMTRSRLQPAPICHSSSPNTTPAIRTNPKSLTRPSWDPGLPTPFASAMACFKS